MHFDEQIDRRGSNCDKWDNMEAKYGVSPEDGLAMWVADGDFRPPACVQQAVQDMAAHGIYGYYGALDHYHKAICWWMETRHNWRVDPDWIFTTHGLGNGIAMCVESFTEAKDGVVLFLPCLSQFLPDYKSQRPSDYRMPTGK
jgi:cystathionine beta-lyase